MKKGLFLLFMAISYLGTYSPAMAKDVTIKWDPNLESDVAGYKLYYKASSSTGVFDGAGAVQGKSPVDVRNVTGLTINGLDAGQDYYFKVTAYDAAGNESGFSNMVEASESVAPVVTITAPADNAAVGGTVTVTATASDNKAVTKVEFLVDNKPVFTATTSPFIFSWASTALPAGAHTITAKAYDEAGNIGTNSITVSTVTGKPLPAGGKGDVTGDGQSDIADAVTLLRAVLNPSLQTAAMKSAGDVWPLDASGKPLGNGVLDLNDARAILQRAVGLISW